MNASPKMIEALRNEVARYDSLIVELEACAMSARATCRRMELAEVLRNLSVAKAKLSRARKRYVEAIQLPLFPQV